ncbi:hypothetical protein ASPCAL13646 [Aspergillus calidoustus]|uniref:Uncharacterized protein n=1 Tax=Aspergillus calidoustus TaxID=454130 RepID=A0A0U5GFH8_ASPCI|nr:hypothetical protein ASPCAL13646 [Aspergillus calidoustus]
MSLQATAQGRLDSCKAGRVERFVGGLLSKLEVRCNYCERGALYDRPSRGADAWRRQFNDYLVEVDLSGPVELSDGAIYNLSLIPSGVPSLKDQALWPNRRNTTLYSYGGRGASNISADEGAWTYTLGNAEWELQSGTVKPVGGYQSSNSTPSITDDTKEHTTVMLQFNTTTGEFSQLDAPFTPVQEGALVYIPNRRLGTLIYFGGEVPSEQSGIDATLTPDNFAQPSSVIQTLAIPDLVVGGGDFESEDIVTDMYLSIPSFKWYTAEGLTEGRMSPTCEAYGRQIFGIGGRLA